MNTVYAHRPALRLMPRDLTPGTLLQHRSGTETRYVVDMHVKAHKNKDGTTTPEGWRIHKQHEPGTATTKSLLTIQRVYMLPQ